MAQFCKKKGIKAHNLTFWRGKILREREGNAAQQKKTRQRKRRDTPQRQAQPAEAAQATTNGEAGIIDATTPSGTNIKVPWKGDAETLDKVLRALG